MQKNRIKLTEAGHLDMTALMPDSLRRGRHLDAKNVILKQKSLLQLC